LASDSLSRFLAGFLLIGLSIRVAFAACTGSETVIGAPTPAISVATTKSLRILEPSFFGFSFVWVEFQESLWNVAAQQVDSEAIKWLRAFPGAVYRYPGGTESNYFDWRAAAGPLEHRAARKAVKWKGPLVANFGGDEYLAFVEAVGGQAWYVVNLYGEYSGATNPRELAASAQQLAERMRLKGGRGPVFLRWELGNELDRGPYLWSAEKYLGVARQVAEGIRRGDPQASFVAIMEDYDAQPKLRMTNAAEYNRRIAAGLADIVSEYAQHSYYDGVNVEVPLSVANRVAQICRSIAAAETGRPAAAAPGIWVTEFARQPVKSAMDADWKPTWSKSANLEAALGMADFVIAATQIPPVKGVFAHALHGLDAPWPLFHKTKAGSPLSPSAIYWALRVLRQNMESEVLPTVTHSANEGAYFGGYDFRATVMVNPARSKWAVWAVNRSSRAQNAELRLTALAGKKVRASLQVLADDNPNANNYLDGSRLLPRDLPPQEIIFGSDGRATLQFAPNSVTGMRLDAL